MRSLWSTRHLWNCLKLQTSPLLFNFCHVFCVLLFMFGLYFVFFTSKASWLSIKLLWRSHIVILMLSRTIEITHQGTWILKVQYLISIFPYLFMTLPFWNTTFYPHLSTATMKMSTFTNDNNNFCQFHWAQVKVESIARQIDRFSSLFFSGRLLL